MKNEMWASFHEVGVYFVPVQSFLAVATSYKHSAKLQLIPITYYVPRYLTF